ncbi:MAG TPA: flavodoxin-dependent (E)-4-hydroxy-3-methylbut-2-enyl-diphosphate synthase [Bacilli bacterium]|jgi:(E)-4-hydroxy-3-methylbut-2-enyl-diphosphate synthase|nr:MAG: 4-hydroxy-3-methylbut-2-en-1-yl diphosphate synthase [Tenericutes bacterium ADurb.Bin140]HON63747.1 flavodoxin-dependent (E)-4-hydroxy-3-methylbut-2-enyl-diphosphate synthase [Bacilli bacterium]HOR95652.1 flavodoxin-dependent (E)-4-hydroxy-3-methylbut-2-enyl-diphosphate synthase [Bacilli bacterium]HPD12748.1 flavodoxin-dependent (E)-4-hydroxy-3-methylbut-2-enyl-diphosphate synthase [Bacilli bacterium]HPK58483.1 flavodoxin-dependent (E)-4-hydroxy-3-methylbut-2-enyl-diphosphate synthase [
MTRKIKIGRLYIGGGEPIAIQSMTNTKTADIEATVKQIQALEKAGADLVRMAIADESDALAIPEIKRRVSVPLVADIHFDYRLALLAIKNGIDKLRLNPGNIKNHEHIKEIVRACQEKQIPIRIGINGGSLDSKYDSVTPENLVASAKEHVEILESLGFYDICISIKTTDIETTIAANRLASETFPYPLHIGLTEAGTPLSGAIRSSYALGTLLKEGIGDTIRISLTGDPVPEVEVAKGILKMFGKIDEPTLISCPTCGRTSYNMLEIISEIEPFLATVKVPLKVAIMGCVVNGPGEARDADIGIAGGKHSAVLFKKGQIVRKLSEAEIIPVLKQEIREMAKEYRQE